MKKVFYFISLFLITSSLISANVYLFDFGPEDSPCASGFTKVSEKDKYSSEKGYGWLGGIRLYSRNENFSTIRRFLKLDPLLCDHVTGGRRFYYPKREYSFKLDLPEGKYLCAVILGKLTEKTGVNTHHLPPFWYKDYVVKANGKKVVEVVNGKKDWKSYLKDFYSANEDDFLPGDSLFDKYVAPYFKIYTFSFISGGSLILELSNVCPINALIIYPNEKEKEFQEKINELKEKSRSFIDNQYKIEKVEEPLSSELVKKYKSQGYILFTRPNEEIFPGSRPKEDEVNRPARKFIPLGEKGVLTFSLLPLKELKDVKLILSDLISKEGAVIPKENLSLWLARYTLQKVGDSYSSLYQIRPWYLLKYKPMNLSVLVSRTFYLYVKVPENIPPGDYQGKIRIICKNAPASFLPIIVKVLPFKLRKPDMLFGMYCYHPGYVFSPGRLKEVKECNDLIIKKMFREMKEMGFNTVALTLPSRPFKIDKNGAVITDEEIWNLWKESFSLYQKFFGNNPLPLFKIGWESLVSPSVCPGFITRCLGKWKNKWKKEGFSKEGIVCAEKIIEHFYQKVKENKWPEVIFYMSDELSNRGVIGGKFGKELAFIYRKIADKVGFRICASMNGFPEHQMLPYLDIAIINRAFPITEETLKEIKNAGCELWFYNIGANRFTYGFYLVKSRPKGRLQWSFGPSCGYVNQIPFLPSLGVGQKFALILDSDLNLGRRIDVEKMRQGIIDYRYYITLESLVKENKGFSNKKLIKAIEKAEKLLSMISDNIKVEIKYYEKVGPWSGEVCERLRWMIASCIIEVVNAKK